MKKKTIITGKKLTIWILNFSILGLIFTSFFPLISAPENDAVKEELYFDFEMMKDSNNYEIYSLVSDVNFINLLFWSIICLGLISIFCIIYLTFLTRWYLGLLTIVSIAISIFSFLLVISQYNFIKDVANMETITLSTVSYTITYVHIIFLFSIVLLIFSILYSLYVILDLGRQILASKSKKHLLKNKEDKQVDSLTKPIIDTQITHPQEPIIKNVKIERWVNQDLKNNDKKPDEDIYTPKKEVMEPIETTTEEKMYVNNKIATSEKKDQPGPFDSIKREEKQEESVKSSVSQSFEEALSSAIEKKQNQIGKKEQNKPISKDERPENTQNKSLEKQEEQLKEKDIITTDVIVKCPQCNNIFTIKKEDTKKIKCPKCGKEGIAQ